MVAMAGFIGIVGASKGRPQGLLCLTAGLHAVDEQDYRKEGGDVHLAYDTAMAEQVNQFSSK